MLQIGSQLVFYRRGFVHRGERGIGGRYKGNFIKIIFEFNESFRGVHKTN